jgi:hypothetical protein
MAPKNSMDDILNPNDSVDRSSAPGHFNPANKNPENKPDYAIGPEHFVGPSKGGPLSFGVTTQAPERVRGHLFQEEGPKNATLPTLQQPPPNPWGQYGDQIANWIKATFGGTELAAAEAQNLDNTSPQAVAAADASATDTAKAALKAAGASQGELSALDKYFSDATTQAQQVGAPVEAAYANEEAASKAGMAGIQQALQGLESADLANLQYYPITTLIQQRASEIPYLLSKEGTFSLPAGSPPELYSLFGLPDPNKKGAAGSTGLSGLPAAGLSGLPTAGAGVLPSLSPTTPTQQTGTYNPGTSGAPGAP